MFLQISQQFFHSSLTSLFDSRSFYGYLEFPLRNPAARLSVCCASCRDLGCKNGCKKTSRFEFGCSCRGAFRVVNLEDFNEKIGKKIRGAIWEVYPQRSHNFFLVPNFLMFFPTPKTTSPRHCIFSSTKDNSPSNVLNFNIDLGLRLKRLGNPPDHRGPPLEKEKKSEQ